MVPESSDVLIAISKPVQVRSKKLDSNRSGISYTALRLLLENNYSLHELLMIIRKNLFNAPDHIFREDNNSGILKEVSINHEVFTIIEEAYDKFNPYIFDKQNLYIEGIKLLKEKNCNINLIEFPFHQILHDRIKITRQC